MSFRPDAHLTRRGFLKLGAAGAAALAAGCKGPLTFGKPPYGSINMGIQSYSFREFSLDETLAKVQQLGLHYIELFGAHLPMDGTPQQIASAKEKMADRKIEVDAYFVGGLDRNEANDRAAFNFLKALDVNVAVADPPADCFDVLDKLMDEYAIKVAIHNHGPGARWWKIDQILNAVKSHHANLGLDLDTGHLMRSGEDPVVAVRKFGARLHGVHIKDVGESNHDVVIGRGRLNLMAFFTALKEIGFDGPFSIEYEIDSKNPVPGITESLAAMREVIAKVS